MKEGVEDGGIGIDNDFGNIRNSHIARIHFEMGIKFFVFTDNPGFVIIPQEFIEHLSHYSKFNDLI